MTVSREAFERQMSFLKDGDRLISVAELAARLASPEAFSSKKVAVTFDDGFEDIYTDVFPMVQKQYIPVTVFLVTAWIGKKGFLAWETIREMSRGGVDFGSHTRSHVYLPSVSSRKTLEGEIRGSKEFLEEKLGKEVPLFSYPVGGFTEEIKEVVRQAGYRAAVTTNRGEGRGKRDLYALTRIKMTEASTPSWIFRIKTSGYYEQFKRKKSPC